MKTFDLMFGCLGNGVTVCDRAQLVNNDYRTVAHISDFGGVKIYDQRLATNTDAMCMIRRHALDQECNFRRWWFQQTYMTQYALWYESLSLSQMLGSRNQWPKEKTAAWLYGEYINNSCQRGQYAMSPAS